MSMTKFIKIIIFLLSANCSSIGQGIELKSTKEGLDIIHRVDYSKEKVIDYSKFGDGVNRSVDLIRFDNLGRTIWGIGPLIVSCKEPIQVDSLGFIPLILQADSLNRLFLLIEKLDTKTYRIAPSQHRLRLTYRFKGQINQYFVVGPEKCTVFLKEVEKKLSVLGGKDALENFYRFVQSSDLLVQSPEGFKWKY
jgi:hypothetical protein